MKPHTKGMSKEEIVDRLLVAFANYDKSMEKRLTSGKLAKDDMKKIKKAMKILSNYPIYIPNNIEEINKNTTDIYKCSKDKTHTWTVQLPFCPYCNMSSEARIYFEGQGEHKLS